VLPRSLVVVDEPLVEPACAVVEIDGAVVTTAQLVAGGATAAEVPGATAAEVPGAATAAEVPGATAAEVAGAATAAEVAGAATAAEVAGAAAVEAVLVGVAVVLVARAGTVAAALPAPGRAFAPQPAAAAVMATARTAPAHLNGAARCRGASTTDVGTFIHVTMRGARKVTVEASSRALDEHHGPAGEAAR